MGKVSKRLRRMQKKGLPVFPCREPDCRKVCATERDLQQHAINAHVNPQHPKKSKHHKHRFRETPPQRHNPMVGPSPGFSIRDSRASSSPIVRQEEAEIIMLIDLATPNPREKCLVCQKPGAIPLRDRCAICDALDYAKKYPTVRHTPRATGVQPDPDSDYTFGLAGVFGTGYEQQASQLMKPGADPVAIAEPMLGVSAQPLDSNLGEHPHLEPEQFNLLQQYQDAGHYCV